jgi:hypothetical protein
LGYPKIGKCHDSGRWEPYGFRETHGIHGTWKIGFFALNLVRWLTKTWGWSSFFIANCGSLLKRLYFSFHSYLSNRWEAKNLIILWLDITIWSCFKVVNPLVIRWFIVPCPIQLFYKYHKLIVDLTINIITNLVHIRSSPKERNWKISRVPRVWLWRPWGWGEGFVFFFCSGNGSWEPNIYIYNYIYIFVARFGLIPAAWYVESWHRQTDTVWGSHANQRYEMCFFPKLNDIPNFAVKFGTFFFKPSNS